MWQKIRRTLAPGLVVVLSCYGMAFAATGSANPLNLAASKHPSHVKHADASSTPKSSHVAGAEKTPKPAKTPKPEKTPKPSHGPKRSTEGCPEGFTGNHGQFVAQSEDKHAAAKSDCGKPVHPEKSPSVSPATTESGDDDATEVENEHQDKNETEPSESPDAEHGSQGQSGEQGEH